ncbi:MAG: YjiG family protein, partial [Acidaminococcaceae bacterium]
MSEQNEVNTAAPAAAHVSKPSVMDIFVQGARKGWHVAVDNIIPNVLMAYVCIKILNVTGALAIAGKIFAPVMAVWGLPGEAIMIILSALMSMGGAVGVAMALYSAGSVDAHHITIVIPAIYLLGSKIQYLGRLLGTAGVPAKHYPVLIAISAVNAAIAMFIMKAL